MMIADDEHGKPSLTQTLGPVQLVLLGVGCIIGAGIYVMTGVSVARVEVHPIAYCWRKVRVQKTPVNSMTGFR